MKIMLQAAMQHQIAALFRQKQGNQPADTPAGAGNQRPFSSYVYHVIFLFSVEVWLSLYHTSGKMARPVY